MVLRLLLVEDNERQKMLFEDAVAEWNEAHQEYAFRLEQVSSFDEAGEALEDRRFDCALFDLRIPKSADGKGKANGGVLAGVGLTQYGMPVGIVSGFPGDYQEGETAHGMLKVFNKGDQGAHAAAVGWLGSLGPMIEVLRATRTNIQRYGADVFVDRVWPRWQNYAGMSGANRDELIAVVTRQYASHTADILGLDVDGGVPWHPFENYVVPALQGAKPNTGDIYKLDDKLWIALSPQCDMATGSIENVILAHCQQDIPNWAAQVALLNQADLSGEKAKSRDRFFKDLVNQNTPSKHFLPPLNGQPIMVEFKVLTFRPLEELQKRLGDRVASVASPFLPNLVQRFGSYISRAGQPNLEVRHFG